MLKEGAYEQHEKKAASYGVRHLQAILLFWGLSFAYSMRVNLSVAIVAMTDRNSTNPNFPEYHWHERTKSLLLSSFFWGYFLTQIPAGHLAQKFGGKIMLLYGMLISGLLNLLTPLCASLGDWPLICALRLVQGLSQGVIFPSCHTILSKWAPAEERGTLGTFTYSGSQFGTVVMLGTSGLLASSSLGWPSIFYISGGLSVLWVGVWALWGASSPQQFSAITAEEVKLIEVSLNQSRDEEERKRQLTTPWLQVLTSLPFLVLLVVQCAHNWGFWMLLTQIPTYMKSVLDKDIKSNALLSALPYFAMLLCGFVFCGISSLLTRYRCVSLSTSRKLFNSIGHWVPMLTIMALGYVSAEHATWAVVLLTITVGVNAAAFMGFFVNHIDLSPNFAGILMGISNCAANIMSVIAPLLVGVIVTDEHSLVQWRLVFFIAAGFYFVGNLLFITLGKMEVQPWNEPKLKRVTTQV